MKGTNHKYSVNNKQTCSETVLTLCQQKMPEESSSPTHLLSCCHNGSSAFLVTDKGPQSYCQKTLELEKLNLPNGQSINCNFSILEISSHQYKNSVIPILQTVHQESGILCLIKVYSLEKDI